MNNSKLLGVVIVLQGMILIGQWAGQPALRSAHADVTLPNPGERQIAILDEIKNTNNKLEHLAGLLTSGDVQVKLVKDDDKK